jgi:hypothetical protein
LSPLESAEGNGIAESDGLSVQHLAVGKGTGYHKNTKLGLSAEGLFNGTVGGDLIKSPLTFLFSRRLLQDTRSDLVASSYRIVVVSYRGRIVSLPYCIVIVNEPLVTRSGPPPPTRYVAGQSGIIAYI